jgi:hypothetical protein
MTFAEGKYKSDIGFSIVVSGVFSMMFSTGLWKLELLDLIDYS